MSADEDAAFLAWEESRCWYDDRCLLELGHEGLHNDNFFKVATAEHVALRLR